MEGPREEHLAPRLAELEQRFTRLEGAVEPSAEKDALSLLHAMVQELWRSLEMRDVPSARRGDKVTLEGVANLYQQAPEMEGRAVSTPLPVGTPAPDFALPDSTGRAIRLSDHRGQRVLLVFYPLDWSPGCSQQLDLYQSELDEFQKRDIQPLAVSVDSIYSHGAWAAVRGLDIPLLADFEPKGEVARRYRVYRDQDGFSERALFLIDEEGVVRYAHVSPQLHHVPDIYELYGAVDGLGQPEPATG